MLSMNVDTSAVVGKLKAVSATTRVNVARAVQAGTQQLLRRVQEKLSGEILNSRSGALRQSMVETGIVAGSSSIADTVASDGSVPYARIQEYGGRVEIPEIVPRNAKALAFEYGGRLVFSGHATAHVVDIPARSFLHSSLAELKTSLTDDICEAVLESLA
jgi:phage gpG-like protein